MENNKYKKRRNRSYELIIIGVFLIFVSCDSTLYDSDIQKEPNINSDILIENSLTFYDGSSYSDLEIVRNAERMQNDLSEIYDGFGGAWINPDDNKKVVIALKKNGDTGNRGGIISNFQPLLTERILEREARIESFSASEYQFEIVEVDYSFKDLQRVRDLLIPIIHERDDIVESSIEVMNNHFSIGLLEGADTSEYLNLLDKYKINTDKVNFYETERIEPDIFMGSANELNMQSTLTLRDFIRPLRGGLQLQGHNPFLSTLWVCTFGFNATLDGVDMWLINSHCTSQFSSTSTTDFYQSILGGPGTLVGSEFRDYSGVGNTRYSDAALVLKSPQTAKLGHILITNGWASGWPQEASVTLIPDGSGNYVDLRIIDEYSDVIPNVIINRVGRTAGWTLGALDNPCVSVSNIAPPMDGWTLHCQIRSTLYSGSGDSGSPVFQFYDDSDPDDITIILNGIHWGRNNSQQRSFHSRMDGIRSDLIYANEVFSTY